MNFDPNIWIYGGEIDNYFMDNDNYPTDLFSKTLDNFENKLDYNNLIQKYDIYKDLNRQLLNHYNDIFMIEKDISLNDMVKSIDSLKKDIINLDLDSCENNTYNDDWDSDKLLDSEFNKLFGMNIDVFDSKMLDLKRELMMHIKRHNYIRFEFVNITLKFTKYSKIINELNEIDNNNSSFNLSDAIQKDINEYFSKIDIKSLIDEYKHLKQIIYTKSLILQKINGVNEKLSVNICGICRDSSVEYAIIPCGHTFCRNCVETIITTCPYCKKYKNNTLRLFFS